VALDGQRLIKGHNYQPIFDVSRGRDIGEYCATMVEHLLGAFCHCLVAANEPKKYILTTLTKRGLDGAPWNMGQSVR
jgi:hypothetical protein